MSKWHRVDYSSAGHVGPARGSIKIPVREHGGSHEHPAVGCGGEEERGELHGHREPAYIDEVLLFRSSAPTGHQHGNVHAGQRKNHVEEAVVVRDGGKLLIESALPCTPCKSPLATISGTFPG